ncbi:IclR family transcriptional regulator [Persicirhabdus sediminis]|uniref:IclR family transcriptional regulator n=1 Tax=Persicirhabdus sediminis TaxID=454144 RepID=A0A8J7SJ36_9BACT|nr:IclR family transcriptional regulator [Persicirhabdus sediminis]MBK1789940.1 IclR family transcriptional regulator [Persicirhabdus sediminis]
MASISSIIKASKVLKRLPMEEKGMSLAEIQREFELSRTTAFRMMNSLCSEGMAQKEGTRYYMGPALDAIALRGDKYALLRSRCIIALRDLAMKTRQTAHLAVRAGAHSLILDVCDSPDPVRVASRSGTNVFVHCSSTGKSLISFLPADKRAELFPMIHFDEPKTEKTIRSADQLEVECARVRDRGYSMDDEEFALGVRCLAAPIFDEKGRVQAAIGITASTQSFPKRKVPEIASIVMDVAWSLSLCDKRKVRVG